MGIATFISRMLGRPGVARPDPSHKHLQFMERDRERVGKMLALKSDPDRVENRLLSHMAPVETDSEEHARRIGEIDLTTENIQGWLKPRAGAMLYDLARFHAPIPTIVELGSWKGKSTVWLASGIKDRDEGRVHTVDSWAGSPEHAERLRDYAEDQLYAEFCRNLSEAGLFEIVTPIRSDTVEASRNWPASEQIGLLFIDADHQYEAVLRDFEYWSPFVADGGLIVFDDVPSWPGPTMLVSQLQRWYEWIGTAPNIWIVRKAIAVAPKET